MQDRKRQEELRRELYLNAQEMAARASRAIGRVLAGEPESSACRAEDVDLRWLRWFARTDISIGRGKAPGKDSVKILKEDWMSWQDTFLTELTGKERYAPDGFDAIFEEALRKALKKREQDVILMRFPEGLTLEEAGRRLGITKERVRQLEVLSLRKLRRPEYRLPLMYGRDYRKAAGELNAAQAEYDAARLKRMAECRAEAERAADEARAKAESLREEAGAVRAGTAGPAEDAGAASAGTPDRVPLAELGLSARAYNALSKHGGAATAGDAAAMTRSGLLAIRGIGKKSADEIEAALMGRFGTGLRQEDGAAGPGTRAPGQGAEDPDTVPLSGLGLSARPYNALARHMAARNIAGHAGRCATAGDVAAMTRREVLSIRNLGKASADEIEAALMGRFGTGLKKEEGTQRRKGGKDIWHAA